MTTARKIELEAVGAVYISGWPPSDANNRTSIRRTTECSCFHGLNYRLTSTKQDLTIVSSGFTARIADTALTTGEWHCIGCSLDEATGAGGGFLYLDGNYDQVGSSNTWDATMSSPSTTAATPFGIGARPNGIQDLPANTRIGGVMIWEGEALTKAEMDTIFNATRKRFGEFEGIAKS